VVPDAGPSSGEGPSSAGGGGGGGADSGAGDEQPAALRLDVTTLEVPQAAYPTEVMCRKCRHLMLPADPEGRAWECWMCSRRIEVVLRPPTAG
jgi:hypothetical protein